MKRNLPQIAIEDGIINSIYTIRGVKVMLDNDLASMYGVETKQLKRQVRRNIDRFPDDFIFELSLDEMVNLRNQFGTSSWGGTRFIPYAFTEQGIAMLSSILNSKRAVAVNIQVMRVFVNIRSLTFHHKDVLRKIDLLERKVSDHDGDIQQVFLSLKRILEPLPIEEKKQIGFIIPTSKQEIKSKNKLIKLKTKKKK